VNPKTTLRLLVIAASASVVFGAGPAFAQDASRAQALFEDGRRLMGEGKFAEACPKLAASQKLDPGAGTLMNLATCYDKNGQTASAWATFKEAAAVSKASNHPDWETAARARASQLEPDLARLTVVVGPSPTTGLVIERDGTPLDPAEWGSPIPIDAGAHTIRATAPGKKPWSNALTVAGPRATAQVTVPALEADSAAGPPGSPGAAVSMPPPAGADEGSTQRLVGIALGGAGLVALGAGVFFGLYASSTYDDARARCNANNECDQEGVNLAGDATTQATISTIAFIGSGVLLAGGAVLYATAPRPASAPGTTKSALTLRSFGLGGLAIRGAF
jgi:hypothetical protein